MTVRVLRVLLLFVLAACGGSDGLSSLGDDLPTAESLRRTVLFNLSYIGGEFELEEMRAALQSCLEQPGAAVTVSGETYPPVRQVSVTGGRHDIRRFEQCLLSPTGAVVHRVPQQVDGSIAEPPGRSLAERYGVPPTWPGDPWTRNGREVSRDELVLAAGAAHCGWEDSAFIAGAALTAPPDKRGLLWVRDPKGVLTYDPRAKAEFQAQADLPSDATWTGYIQDGVELWAASSDNADYLYLVNNADGADIERWVRVDGACR